MPRGIGYGKKRRTLGPQGVRPVVGAGTMQPLYGKRRNYFDPMQDMGADFRVRPPGGSPQYQTQQAAQAVQSRLGQPDPMIQRQQMRELGRQSIPAPLTPRMDAVNQLGAQNMAGIQGDPRMLQYGIAQAPNLGEMPAADAYRQMQASDPAGPYSGMSGGYSQQRLLNTGNQLGLARTPNVPGEGAGESIAYRPGASGSSPFVSDGPLSGGPRSPELQKRLDQMKRDYGIDQGGEAIRGGTRTRMLESPSGGVMMIGQQAEQTGMTPGQLYDERRGLMSGIPTTRDPETGEVIAKHEYQQDQLDTRRRRLGEVRDFREQRRMEGQRRLGQAPAPQQGQQGAVPGSQIGQPLGKQSQALIDNEIGIFDDEGKRMNVSDLTFNEAREASVQQADGLWALYEQGVIKTPEQLMQEARRISKDYPESLAPFSLIQQRLQQELQKEERRQQRDFLASQFAEEGGDPSGADPEVVESAQDIAERRRIEEELRKRFAQELGRGNTRRRQLGEPGFREQGMRLLR